MIDKSITFFITVLFAIGGVVILTVTWMGSMSLSERIVPSVIGAAGIIVVFVRILVIRVRATSVHIAHASGKTEIKKNDA